MISSLIALLLPVQLLLFVQRQLDLGLGRRFVCPIPDALVEVVPMSELCWAAVG